MTKPKAPKVAKAPKPPAERTVKSFFKLLDQDKAEDVAKQVGKLGANLRYNNGYGEKPALVAAAGAHRCTTAASLRVLLDAGADLHGTDSRGRTALHAAADEGNVEAAKLLLERGAAHATKDTEGQRPYSCAGTVAMRKLLRAHGDPGLGTRGGHTLSPVVQPNAKNMEIARGALGVDREGIVWFAGYTGIFRYDGKTTTRYRFSESMAFGAVTGGPPGVVYFATNWGLLELKEDVFTLFTSADSELFDHHITDMFGGPDGRIYLLSYEGEADHKHITVFDGTTFSILEPGVDFPAELDIVCLAFDCDGKLAIGADDKYASQRDGGWHVETEFGDAFSPRVYDVVIERDVTWLGCPSGVIEMRGGEQKLHRMAHLAKHLCKDGDDLWIGLSYGGVSRMRGDEITTFTKSNSELPDDDIENLVRAPDGRIWIHAGGGAAYVEGGEILRFD